MITPEQGSGKVPLYFPITIKTLTGQNIIFDVNPTTTILEVKEKINVRQGIPLDQQRLLFNEIILEDDKTLDYYNIKENSIIYLLLKIRGG